MPCDTLPFDRQIVSQVYHNVKYHFDTSQNKVSKFVIHKNAGFLTVSQSIVAGEPSPSQQRQSRYWKNNMPAKGMNGFSPMTMANDSLTRHCDTRRERHVKKQG